MDHQAGSFRHLRLGVLGVVFGVLVLALLATPGTASAFIGESVVLNPAKTDLTGPAKTILTNPTFLPETTDGAAALGGVAEESAAAGVFEGAGILPALASVVSFGVGTVIGSEICKVIGIEGCWYFGSEGADPATGVAEYHWNWIGAGEGKYPFNWYWSRGEAGYKYGSGAKSACGNVIPGGMSLFDATGGNTACGVGEKIPTPNGLPWRWAMENRVLDYHAVDDPGTSNYAYTAPSNWSEKLAKQLKEHSGDAAGRVGQKIASKIGGSGVSDPYPHKVTIPSCSGESWIECKGDLEELELVPERVELDWSDAHLDLAPDEVVELDPAPSTKVEVPSESAVVVTTNPDDAGMPIVVPQPEPGETYSHYAARLNSGLSPERHDLEAAFVSPSTGPNGVVSVQPEPETRLDPSTTHKVDVSTNPADAPMVAAPWSPPSIPSISMAPLTTLGSPCSVFPFGLLCWLGEGLAQFNTAGVCPHAAVPVNDEADFELTLCGETSDQVMGYVRPALLLVFIVGCGFLFAKATKAIGGD